MECHQALLTAAFKMDMQPMTALRLHHQFKQQLQQRNQLPRLPGPKTQRRPSACLP